MDIGVVERELLTMNLLCTISSVLVTETDIYVPERAYIFQTPANISRDQC